MNCKGCGDSLALNRAGDGDVCVACHAEEMVRGLESMSPDGTKRTGQEVTGVDCPRCSLPLQIGFLDGEKIATCPSCQGNLLSLPTFAQIVRARRLQWRGPDESPIPLQPMELHQHARCPACLQKMETYPYAGPGAVVIDNCVQCQLIWVDCGELVRIERAPGSRV